ncbi:MAG: hypothetical protein ACI9ZH_002363 [Paracoccaceae bacterium]|jgi:hypothetical protein
MSFATRRRPSQIAHSRTALRRGTISPPRAGSDRLIIPIGQANWRFKTPRGDGPACLASAKMRHGDTRSLSIERRAEALIE